MTVEQFEQQLAGFGENLSNMQTILTEIAGRIVDDMKSNAPQNTGELIRSIKSRVTESDLEIIMLNYGISPQPANGRRFGFSGDYQMIGGNLPFGVRKKIYQLGIKPQPFFNIDDMSELITEYVAERLIQNNF